MKRRTLLVEDDRDLAELARLHLGEHGFEVEVEGDGTGALRRLERESYDLIVLDLMLPGTDGWEVCRQLRARGDFTPLLILTARSTEVDRVLGLELGADDYLTKPFSFRELVARAKAILRRVEQYRPPPEDERRQLRRGELQLDLDQRTVRIGDQQVQLTAKEFDLLACFAQRPGRVFSRADLLGQVWGLGFEGYEHTVNTHINRLRAKIEADPARPAWILTVWGVGYKFREEER